ncbi:MAG TPA: aldo/keto reductase [Candidatus Thermoplasmatota archaeon]|nr:aldo/keto reductase [Candidatus Thermoplasmatota archaeon]
MRTRPFGPDKVPVSVIGQGTWRWSSSSTHPASLEEGIRLGMTHVDTAELYERQSGSETMLGDLLSRPAAVADGATGATLRDGVFLASKVMPEGASRRETKAHCKDSLVRLQTDHLDLYYLHWRGPHPVADTMAALAELVDMGWVRHIGVSNFDVADLDEAKAALGPGVLAANQVLYHLEERGMESEVLPWCRKEGVAVVAYSPFGAGRFVPGKGRKVLDDVAKGLGRTPRQVALAFLVRDPAVFAIPKAERVEHVRDNAGGDLDLPPEAIDRLDRAFPLVPGLVHH